MIASSDLKRELLPRKCNNPDSRELDVVGVNRHLLEIVLLKTSNCLIEPTMTI